MMNSSAYHNSHDIEYLEVFKVLDSLGMADLKQTFQEHCIQDQTLNYVDTEDELKSLLKEIGIPLGRCIPIVKSWSKRHISQEHKKMPSKKVTAEKCTQVAIETTNTGVQTDDLFITGADYDKLINNVTEMNLSSEQRLVNHFAEAELPGGSMNTQAPVSFGTQQIGPYFAAQMWPSISQYPGYANMNMYSPFLQEPSSSVPSSMAVSDGISSHPNVPYNHNVPDMCHTSNPMMSSSASVQKTTSYQKMTMNTTSPKDIVDEREDLAIEQSLNDFETMELKSQPSYASALHLETPGLSQKSQHSTKNYTINTQPIQHQRIQVSPVSESPPLPAQTPRTLRSEKVETSNFTKCDDISVLSGATRLSSSVQNVGPKTLQGYLDVLPETQEYRQAIQSRNPAKGWKPLDGKNISTGKKAAFKPMYWDKEGRMRHGVPVRGSDKSEECFKHVEGKAPAGCTFAHSRLGDTLQFICVKCTYERNRNDWCSEKTKHKQYIYNIGPYRNLEGEIWKKRS